MQPEGRASVDLDALTFSDFAPRVGTTTGRASPGQRAFPQPSRCVERLLDPVADRGTNSRLVGSRERRRQTVRPAPTFTSSSVAASRASAATAPGCASATPCTRAGAPPAPHVLQTAPRLTGCQRPGLVGRQPGRPAQSSRTSRPSSRASAPPLRAYARLRRPLGHAHSATVAFSSHWEGVR